MYSYHKPVLLKSACDLLEIKPNGKYVDATLGGGGHSMSILDRGGRVLAIDQDQDAILESQTSLRAYSDRLIIENSNFSNLTELVNRNNWYPVDGILFDFGVSMHQLRTPSRGFSFQSDGPLDMRMDKRQQVDASYIVNTFSKEMLKIILFDLGEEKKALQIANKIISNRPIVSTNHLSRLLSDDNTRRRVFQAIRMAVNDELGSIENALNQTIELLSVYGKVVAISFHSLEDRLVKNKFKEWMSRGLGTIDQRSPVVPNKSEILENPSSKSAKLRSFKKI